MKTVFSRFHCQFFVSRISQNNDVNGSDFCSIRFIKEIKIKHIDCCPNAEKIHIIFTHSLLKQACCITPNHYYT